jgi:hypothetical protein
MPTLGNIFPVVFWLSPGSDEKIVPLKAVYAEARSKPVLVFLVRLIFLSTSRKLLFKDVM